MVFRIWISLMLLAAPSGALGDSAALLESDLESLQARRDILSKKNPFMTVYELAEDKVGFLIAHDLVKAAREGRNPRLVVDAHMVGRGKAASMEFLAYLKSEGVEVKLHRPITLRDVARRGLGQINQRMHVKVITNGEGEVLTGSRNLNDNHFGLGKYDYAHHDIDAVVFGKSAEDARSYQQFLWDGPNTGEVPKVDLSKAEIERFRVRIADTVEALEANGIVDDRRRNWRARAVEVESAEFIYDKKLHTTGAYEGTSDNLIQLLRQAKDDFLLESQYFIPDEELIQEMEKAVKERGVKVRILANGWDAHIGPHDQFTRTAYEMTMKRLVGTGIEVREFQGPGKIHSKQVVIDNRKCNVWSHNIDNRSKRLNLEAGVQLASRHLCGKLRDKIEVRYSGAKVAIAGGRQVRPPACPTFFQKIGTRVLWPLF